MNRAAYKRLERGVQKLVKDDGDHCTVCRRPFVHGDRTHYGRIAGQRPAITGDCCADRINQSLGMGVYTDRQYDVIPEPGTGSAKAGPKNQEALSTLVDGIRTFISKTDARAADIGARAGLRSKSAATYLKPAAWKADDAAWFAARPDRSHRLRSLLEGELAALPEAYRDTIMPHNHELQVLVRQVEPGARVRTLFGRNLSAPIADDEAVIHALFDLVSQRPAGSTPEIDAPTLQTLAAQYGQSGRAPAS